VFVCRFDVGLFGSGEEVAAWQARRDQIRAKVNWQFTTENARIKLKRLYPTFYS